MSNRQTGWWGSPYSDDDAERLRAVVPRTVITTVAVGVVFGVGAHSETALLYLVAMFTMIDVLMPANPWTFRGRVLEVLDAEGVES